MSPSFMPSPRWAPLLNLSLVFTLGPALLHRSSRLHHHLLNNTSMWSSTPSQPLFSSRTSTSCPSVTNALHQCCLPIEHLNAVANTLTATPLTWDITALAFNVTLSGHRLSTPSPLVTLPGLGSSNLSLVLISPQTLWDMEVTLCFHSGAHCEGGIF